jgi:hypothetical protein
MLSCKHVTQFSADCFLSEGGIGAAPRKVLVTPSDGSAAYVVGIARALLRPCQTEVGGQEQDYGEEYTHPHPLSVFRATTAAGSEIRVVLV